MRDGDVIVVSNFSRLARSTKDMLQSAQDLTDKGFGLISMKENLATDTPHGKFMLTVFAALAKLERTKNLQRQREVIEISKVEGRHRNRKPKPVDEELLRAECVILKAGEQTAAAVMRKKEIRPIRFYRLVKQFGIVS